jgi:hypothetical protein
LFIDPADLVENVGIDSFVRENRRRNRRIISFRAPGRPYRLVDERTARREIADALRHSLLHNGRRA